MSGFFAPYAIFGSILLVGIIVITLIIAIGLSKILKRKWIFPLIMALMMIFLYFNNMVQSAILYAVFFIIGITFSIYKSKKDDKK